MRRFILQANVTHFEKLLQEPLGADAAATVRYLLSAAQRELALVEATELGAGHAGLQASRGRGSDEAPDASPGFRDEFEHAPQALILIDPGPSLQILDANEAYRRLTGREREALVGRPVFDVFPDNPDNAFADGLAKYFGSLRTAAQSGASSLLDAQRYDLTDADGVFAERYWRLLSTPMFDPDGQLTVLVTEVDEVTGEVLCAAEADA